MKKYGIPQVFWENVETPYLLEQIHLKLLKLQFEEVKVPRLRQIKMASNSQHGIAFGNKNFESNSRENNLMKQEKIQGIFFFFENDILQTISGNLTKLIENKAKIINLKNKISQLQMKLIRIYQQNIKLVIQMHTIGLLDQRKYGQYFMQREMLSVQAITQQFVSRALIYPQVRIRKDLIEKYYLFTNGCIQHLNNDYYCFQYHICIYILGNNQVIYIITTIIVDQNQFQLCWQLILFLF